MGWQEDNITAGFKLTDRLRAAIPSPTRLTHFETPKVSVWKLANGEGLRPSQTRKQTRCS